MADMRMIPMLFLAACAAAPETAVDQIRERAKFAGNDLAPHWLETVMPAALDMAPPTWALARVVQPPGLGDVKGGLPVVTFRERPKVGVPWQAAFHSRPTGRLSSDDPLPLAILAASQRPGEPVPLPGTDGGWLMVHPDLVLLPRAGSFLTQAGGTMTVDITFPPGSQGMRWFMQALFIERDRNAVSPMLELIVGDK